MGTRTKGLYVGLAATLAAVLATATVWDAAVAGGPGGYRFQLLARVGDPLPGPAGGTFVNDFEPGGLNDRGDVAFGADASTGGEGIFLRRGDAITELARTGGAAPGGGTYDFGFLGPVRMNAEGDLTYVFFLTPFEPPNGVNAGVFRYQHTTGAVGAVVVPFVTPVPGGGGATFQGASFEPSINNRGDLLFAGLIETELGIHNVPDNGEPYVGLGFGVYRADRKGRITAEVVPGDPAPGGSWFDYAVGPSVNDGGDVAFLGHVAGRESVIPGFPPQAENISALTGVYVKDAAKGTIRAIVRPGDPAPRGGVFRQAFHEVMNNRGEIAFTGDLTPAPDVNMNIGVFLYTGGKVVAVARRGDPMPGGGRLVNASLIGGNIGINNAGEVVFTAQLDDDQDGDGTLDTGLYRWSGGRTVLVARSGTVVPGVGTIYQLAASELIIPPPPIVTPSSGAVNNERGQVIFQPTMTDGSVVLLLATPAGSR